MIGKSIRPISFMWVLALCAAPSLAQTPVLTSFTGGGGPFAAFYGDTVLPSYDLVGYRFTADADIFITDLGILDDPIDGVLDSAHEVTLWRNSDMSLLASTSVSSADPLIGGFYYGAIAPVALSAGQGYTLAAGYAIDDNDGYLSGPSSASFDSISGTVAVFPDQSNLGLTYPGSQSAGNLGRLGPNALFVPVPEPTGLALSMLGLGLFVALRRRK